MKTRITAWALSALMGLSATGAWAAEVNVSSSTTA